MLRIADGFEILFDRRPINLVGKELFLDFQAQGLDLRAERRLFFHQIKMQLLHLILLGFIEVEFFDEGLVCGPHFGARLWSSAGLGKCCHRQRGNSDQSKVLVHG